MRNIRLGIPVFILFKVVLLGGCVSVQQTERESPFIHDHVEDTDSPARDCGYSGLFEPSWEFLKDAKRDSIPDAVNVLGATVTWEDGLYVFNIRTRGNVKEAREKYGARIQFEVNLFTLNGRHGMSIFTTAESGQAVLVRRSDFLRETPHIFFDVLRYEARGNEVKLYLPPEWLSNLDSTRSRGGRWCILLSDDWREKYLNEKYFEKWVWHVTSYFAPPPAELVPVRGLVAV